MSKEKNVLDVMDRLVDEVRRLNVAQTVQRSAYLLLVQHLAAKGHANPQTLLASVETLAQTQDEPGWQEGHAQLAAELRLLCGLPSVKRR